MHTNKKILFALLVFTSLEITTMEQTKENATVSNIKHTLQRAAMVIGWGAAFAPSIYCSRNAFLRLNNCNQYHTCTVNENRYGTHSSSYDTECNVYDKFHNGIVLITSAGVGLYSSHQIFKLITNFAPIRSWWSNERPEQNPDDFTSKSEQP